MIIAFPEPVTISSNWNRDLAGRVVTHAEVKVTPSGYEFCFCSSDGAPVGLGIFGCGAAGGASVENAAADITAEITK